MYNLISIQLFNKRSAVTLLVMHELLELQFVYSYNRIWIHKHIHLLVAYDIVYLFEFALQLSLAHLIVR